jgi:DNA-binding GntR family transcriptional regulator
MNEAFGLSLPQQIAQVIAGEIIELELPLGHKLPEMSLAKRFGTSRASVREALYLLAQEGLIERSPRKGAYVRELPRREIEELYRVRAALEELALERISESPDKTEACLMALDTIMSKMEKAHKDTKQYHELNFRFHKTIVETADSHLLLNLYRQIEGPLKILLRVSFEAPDAVLQSLNEHKKILAAINQGNPREACSILVTHDTEGMQRAIAVLSSVVKNR